MSITTYETPVLTIDLSAWERGKVMELCNVIHVQEYLGGHPIIMQLSRMGYNSHVLWMRINLKGHEMRKNRISSLTTCVNLSEL